MVENCLWSDFVRASDTVGQCSQTGSPNWATLSVLGRISECHVQELHFGGLAAVFFQVQENS
jgi:hypothetical protein